jgi:hypothetical protein
MKDIKNKVTKIILLTVISSPVIANEFVVAIDRDENNYIDMGITSWVNEGVPYNCSNWTPDESLIDYGTNVEQERTCDQDQIGTQKTSEGTLTHYQTINVQEKQIVLGTYDYVVGTTTGSWSAWTTYNASVHESSLYNCGSWVQYAEDSSYVYQRALCKFDQTRTRTIYDDWLSGNQTVNRVETGINTVNQYKYRKLVKAIRQ